MHLARTSFRRVGLLALAFLLSPLPIAASAQALYRCGAVYQDRPCKGVDSKVVGRASSGSAEPASDAWAPDPSCRERGAAAQKLMWEKESGRTLDEQLTRGGADPDLVKRVYARRGSSVDVRRAIEAECMKELERGNDASGAPRAPARLPGMQSGDASSLPGAPAHSSAPPDAGQGAGASRAPGGKAKICASLGDDLASVTDALRTGGDAATMDELAARLRALQSRKRAAGC